MRSANTSRSAKRISTNRLSKENVLYYFLGKNVLIFVLQLHCNISIVIVLLYTAVKLQYLLLNLFYYILLNCFLFWRKTRDLCLQTLPTNVVKSSVHKKCWKLCECETAC